MIILSIIVASIVGIGFILVRVGRAYLRNFEFSLRRESRSNVDLPL